MRRCAELPGCSGGRHSRRQQQRSRHSGQMMTWSWMGTPACCPAARRQPCSAAHAPPGHRRLHLQSLPPRRRRLLAAQQRPVSMQSRPALRGQRERWSRQLPAGSQLPRRQRPCSQRLHPLRASLQLWKLSVLQRSSSALAHCCPLPLTCRHRLRSQMQQSSRYRLRPSQMHESLLLSLLRLSLLPSLPAACSVSRRAACRSPPSR